MNPGPATLDFGDVGQRLELGRDQCGQRARVGPRPLGEHHRGIGGEVAVACVARRLDRDGLAVEPGRQRALGFKGVEHFAEKRVIGGINGHGRPLAQDMRALRAASFAARRALAGSCCANPLVARARIVKSAVLKETSPCSRPSSSPPVPWRRLMEQRQPRRPSPPRPPQPSRPSPPSRPAARSRICRERRSFITTSPARTGRRSRRTSRSCSPTPRRRTMSGCSPGTSERRS